MMKKGIVIVFVVFMLMGCGTTSEDRIALYQQALQQAQVANAQLDAALKETTTVIEELRAEIAGKLTPEQGAFANEQLDKAVAIKTKIEVQKGLVDGTLKALETKINALAASGRTDAGVDLEAIGAVIGGAGAIPSPLTPYLLLGGSILSIIGAVLGRASNRGTITKTKAALVEVVSGVEELLSTLPARSAAVTVLKDFQSIETQAAVKTILEPK
jgi:ABC-type glycerol-3-phosphate transport system substrate-binding protein